MLVGIADLAGNVGICVYRLHHPNDRHFFVCRRHVANVGLTRRRHSVMSANILAVRPILTAKFFFDVFFSSLIICFSFLRFFSDLTVVLMGTLLGTIVIVLVAWTKFCYKFGVR